MTQQKRKKPSTKKAPGATAKTSQPKTDKGKKCIHSRCKNEAKLDGYCRLHYIANWKAIRFSQHVKAEQRLNSYVDRLVKKYPEKYLDKIKEALESEDKFKEAMDDLDLDFDSETSETDREFLEKFVHKAKINE